MKNTPSTRRFCLYILVMIFVCATNRGRISATLSERSENPVASTSLPYAVRGQLIVKYKDTVTGCVHCIVRKGLSISHSVAGEGNGLEDLHSRYGVYFAKPVFRTTEEEERMFGTSHVSTDSLKQYHRNKLDLHRSRFPGIAGRSSAGSTFPDLHHIYLLKLSENADVSGAVEEFSADPNVAYAQPDYVAEITLNPNDKYFRSSGSWGQRYDDLWALKQNQLNLGPAWDITQGDGVVVGVVDTGLDYNHKDIAGNVWSNPGEIDGNNIDDDGNGLVDDHRGYDFTTCQAVTRDGCLSPKDADNDPFDGHFHGTHVSGTIAATGGNRRGIIGVAPRAKILPVKGLNDRGQGQLSELAAALVYAASNGADVINNSWSCGFCPRNPLGEDAVQTAHKLGVVVVFSAGNNATNVRGRSPQNSKRFKPVVVAASNQKNQPTSFTNFGSTVDVTAPGGGTRGNDLSNILSLAPQPCDECPKNCW